MGKITGGCQCGQVRYRAEAEELTAYLCHCRMCQKATGGFAASFVNMPVAALTWDSEPNWYASSPIAMRPFCATCGTPLGFKFNDGQGIDVTFGTIDNQAGLDPQSHAGAESIHEAWIDTSALPRQRSDETHSVVSRWTAAGLPVPG
ncbi:MAG: GFA family protein [Croceibacterium sp.]